MRDQWYGDNRDLVKWGAVLTIARQHQATRVLQVAYRRPSAWGDLRIDGEPIALPEAVLSHFRALEHIRRMDAGIPIDLIAEPFEDRAAYAQIVARRLGERTPDDRLVVLLDPDTGLEPPGHPNMKHVLESEVRDVWDRLQPGDVLMLYQHQTNRGGQPWIEDKRAQFEDAIGVDRGSSKVVTGERVAGDVAFFWSPKIESRGANRVPV